MKRDTGARVCVIGAGPSGITALKNLLQVGLTDVVAYEKNDQIGGNWVYSPEGGHSSVYETTHIISSKSLSEYEDFPMPDHYPDYPSHEELLDYFNAYVDHFDLRRLIRFNREVVRAEHQPDDRWRVTLDDGSEEVFDSLLVANGHHWAPRLPSYPGTFSGEFLHSHDYKRAEPFRGRRVLVIGGGNSACDIAVETGRVTEHTAISMRRGYWIAPKFINGVPTDVFASKSLWIPKPIRMLGLRLMLRLLIGKYEDYGLQEPEHGLLNAHIVINSELLYAIRHGRVHPRQDVKRFDGRKVHFVDGTVEKYDAVIAATGFKIKFPFFDEDFIDWTEGQPVPLYLRTFHPTVPSLFFIGLVQPLGCIWPLSDLQSKLVGNTIVGNWDPPENIGERAHEDAEMITEQYINTPRHTIEVDYFEYREKLEEAIPPQAPAWTS